MREAGVAFITIGRRIGLSEMPLSESEVVQR